MNFHICGGRRTFLERTLVSSAASPVDSERLRLPEFIIGGAPRSGTTWLYNALARHPRIYMALPVQPEPKFFLIDALYGKGLAHYSRAWFAKAPDHCVCGEKSTNYLENAVTATRIHTALPNVRLIFMLRNPVDRAISNYHWSCRNGLESEDFSSALRLETSRNRTLDPALRYARPHAYFSRGLYARMLRAYFDVFSRDAILCLDFADIQRRPSALLRKVHLHLGLEPRPHDADGLGVINPSKTAANTGASSALRCDLERRYSAPNRELAALLGRHFATWTNEGACV